MTRTVVELGAIEHKIKTYGKNFIKYQLSEHLHDRYPNKKAPKIWKAQNYVLDY